MGYPSLTPGWGGPSLQDHWVDHLLRCGSLGLRVIFLLSGRLLGVFHTRTQGPSHRVHPWSRQGGVPVPLPWKRGGHVVGLCFFWLGYFRDSGRTQLGHFCSVSLAFFPMLVRGGRSIFLGGIKEWRSHPTIFQTRIRGR